MCARGLLVNCMPDSGASKSIVSAAIARDADLIIVPTLTELCNTSNYVMRLVGEATVILSNNKHSVSTTVLVASDLTHSALIGRQDLQKLHVIPASFPTVAATARCFVELKTKTLSAFPSVFSDSLDNKPVCVEKMKSIRVSLIVSAPRPIPLHFQEPANAEIKKHIEVSLSPAVIPLIGVPQPFLCQKAMGKRYTWLRITLN